MSDRPLIAQCLEYPIRDYGGIEILVHKLIEGLAKNFRVLLVSNDPTGSLEGSAIGSLIEKHLPLSTVSTPENPRNRMAQKFKDAGVQLAHFHGATYSYGARVLNRSPIIQVQKAGIPVIYTNHGAFTLFDYCAHYRPLWLKLLSLPYAWLSKLQVVAHCETEIAVSRNDLNNLRSWYWPVRKKFRVLYHSQLATEDPPLPAVSRNPVILYVGTIGKRKGHIILARAFAKIAQHHPNWSLVMAGRKGESQYRSPILDVRDRAGLSDRLLLKHDLSDREIAGLMGTSAIFCMPSLHEGLGLSLQEALYRGCACVASRVGGIQDLIDDNINGLFVEPGNVEQLASALDKLINDHALRERLSAASRPSILAKGMTAVQMVENYTHIYRSILNPGKSYACTGG